MKTKRLVLNLLILSIILLLEASFSRAEDTCIAYGDRCQTDQYADDCCQEGAGVSCIQPYLGVGFTKCRTCAAEGQSCESRTDCCTNCCSSGECVQNWDNCNFTETIETVALYIGLIVLGVCVCCIAIIICCVCICNK